MTSTIVSVIFVTPRQKCGLSFDKTASQPYSITRPSTNEERKVVGILKKIPVELMAPIAAFILLLPVIFYVIGNNSANSAASLAETIEGELKSP